MRVFIYLIFVIICSNGCNKTGGKLAAEKISIDTIYGGDFIWREKQEDKRLTIIFDDGISGDPPAFKLNEENLMRIRVKRLLEYEIFPSEIHGAEIVKVDTSENLFLITPTDSSFKFVINQYYKGLEEWDECEVNVKNSLEAWGG